MRDRVRAVAEKPPVWLIFWGKVAGTWWLVWFAWRLRGHDWAQLGVGALLGFGLTLSGVGLWLGAAVRDLQRQRAEPEKLERDIYGRAVLESDLESWLEADGSLTLVIGQRRLKRLLQLAKRSGGAVELHVPKETEDERQRRVALGQWGDALDASRAESGVRPPLVKLVRKHAGTVPLPSSMMKLGAADGAEPESEELP